jgi:prophage antirepressor-like protein
MAQIIPFGFEDHLIRVVMRDGDPWFVVADVCRVLGIQNAPQAVQNLDEDEKGICSTYTPGGQQDVLIVSEGGLYTLVLRSRSATTPGSVAHRFRRWVTGEVLPSIRRTGAYAPTPVAAPPPQENVADRTTKVAIDMVHQARMLWGKSAAKRLWLDLGLPAVHPADAAAVAGDAPQKWDVQSPLTLDQEDEVRRRYAAGGVTMRQLADEYGVSVTAISRAWRRPPR